MTATGNDCTK